MTSRPLIALVLVTSLFGSLPSPALWESRDDGSAVTRADAAVAASSVAAEPIVLRGAPAGRPMLALPAPVLPAAASMKAPVAAVDPLVQAARPDVVTRPSQGPPAAG